MFVYLGSEVLARQQQSTDNTQSVVWEHRDASNASYRITGSDGTIHTTQSAELDPLGTNAGTSNPIPNPTFKPFWSYQGFGSTNTSSSTSCILDGVPTPCSEVSWLISAGGAGLCPNNNCGPTFNGNEWQFLHFTDDGMGYGQLNEYAHAQRPTKPKLKPAKNQTPKQREKAKREAQKRRGQDAGKGNNEDDLKNTLTIEGFDARQEFWIRYEMQKLVTPNCSAAYEVSQNPLRSPRTIMETRGVVIRHADVLSSRSAADLGLDTETFRDAQKKANSGQGGTVFGIDERLHIFLNSYAFLGPTWDGKLKSLSEVLKHEFIHEGLSEWPDPLWPEPLGHDLSGFPGYNRIMEGCR